MIDNTINDDKTIAGGGEDAILAGRYRSLTRWDKVVRVLLCVNIKRKGF